MKSLQTVFLSLLLELRAESQSISKNISSKLIFTLTMTSLTLLLIRNLQHND